MDILENPFHIIGASVRDNKQSISDLIEEKTLDFDEEEISRINSILLNPKRRLAAEISYLPGIAPKRTKDIISTLISDPSSLFVDHEVSGLAELNLRLSKLNKVKEELDSEDIADNIIAIAEIFEEIDENVVHDQISADRIVSGFPPVDLQVISSELAEHGNYCKRIFGESLKVIEHCDIPDTLNYMVKSLNTSDGNYPKLIIELIEKYELEFKNTIDEIESDIFVTIVKIRNQLEKGDTNIVIGDFEPLLMDWELYTYPLQKINSDRGLDHVPTLRIYGKLRDLSLELNNDYKLNSVSLEFTKLLQSEFSHIPSISEDIEEDLEILQEMEDTDKLHETSELAIEKCKKGIKED